MQASKIRILSIFGTRPEVIKFFPILREFQRWADMESRTVSTAQHREMIQDLFQLFRLKPDFDLAIITPNQSLTDISVKAMRGLEPILAACRPHLVLVQGDTTTAFTGALAAFYQQTAVGHVEAGLRSFDKQHPFPEEINRKLITAIGDLHFSPTRQSAANLIREGVHPDRVFVTGNTVIDALHHVAGRNRNTLRTRLPREALTTGRMILVTAHRRENWGAPLQNLCRVLTGLVGHYPDVQVVYPVHFNPNVREIVFGLLQGVPRIHLIDPLPYEPFIEAMKKAFLIITDSGGVQEEGPALGKPILVFRQVTERPEGVLGGGVKLVGTDERLLLVETMRLLDDPENYGKMAMATSPYGDGLAGRRIVGAIRYHFNKGPRPMPFLPIGPEAAEGADPPDPGVRRQVQL